MENNKCWKLHVLLVKMQNNASAMEKNLAVPQKVKPNYHVT
jgi:hypothetical protein